MSRIMLTAWLVSIIVLALGAASFAATEIPTAMSYQGKLTDASGAVVPDGLYKFQFKLYSAASGGSAFWTSSSMQLQTTGGLFTARLEDITASTLAGNSDFYLETCVGDPATALAPRVRLASAPFALRSSDLALPFVATLNSSSDVLSLTNSGSGNVITMATSGDGRGIDVSTSGSGEAICAVTSGTNKAGWFAILNTANVNPAVSASSNGSGNVIDAICYGTGRAGYFHNSGAGNSSSALLATTDGSGQAVYGSCPSTYGHLGGSASGASGSHSSSGNNGALGLSAAGASGANTSTGNYGYLGTSTAGVSGVAASGVASGRGVTGTASGATSIGVYGESTGASGVGVYGRGGSTGLAAKFSGNVRIVDRSTDATVIELGTGLDYAEGFEVTGKDEVTSGCVLIIDEKNSGKLTMSTSAYDCRVAGIVAGANSLGSGVRLGVDGFDHDVALAGRVYCNVDATKAAIKPGDMLTTSSTPGYAMKATNRSRAQGAILGKAMEPLARGKRGQILVLVTLQ